jgi:hypothetical protein
LLTALSGNESILVAQLRQVIAKQAAEIGTLQNKLKKLSVAAAETATYKISRFKFAVIIFGLVAGVVVVRKVSRPRKEPENKRGVRC